MCEKQLHTRWRIELPLELEDAVSDWLLSHGASAVYRQIDPPMEFYSYFPPGFPPISTDGLDIFEGVSITAVESFDDEDWLAKSREGFGTLEVGQRFYIRPLWNTNETPVGRFPIVVNPGLAFGTGGHETTRLCMELLEDLAMGCPNNLLPWPVLDIGSGTGILAFCAHLLGAEDITALDIDPDCGPVMEEFIQLNATIARHTEPFYPIISTLDDPCFDRKYNLILANILLETIQELLPLLLQRLAPQGYLIASGILAERQDEALLSLACAGLKPIRVLIEGEWIAILAKAVQ